ncbi:MAG: outer membrane beta-barrel protein [Stagnimonas sp.]|nr:outer membrane beta-barrel protein [Stagnimonas sp.]
MFKKLLLASLLAVPAVSMAEGLSYNYAQATYQSVDIDGTSVSPDGFGIAGSYLFGKTVFAQAEYSALSAKGFDLDTFGAGLGLRHGLNDKIDVTAGAGLVFAKVKGGGFSDDDTGYTVRGGLRAQVMPKLELNGGVAYTDVFDDGNTSFLIGGVVSITSQFALVAGAELDEDATGYNIGGRFNF